MIRADKIATEAPVLAPAWVANRAPASVADAAFYAGAALAALDGVARQEAPWSGVWRKRLALTAAAASVRGGVDPSALRDALALTRAGDDPGPVGRLLVAWRALTSRPTRLWPEAFASAAQAVQLAPEAAGALRAAAQQAAAAQVAPIPAAAAAAAQALRLRPELPVLALWLADAILAERLNWATPAPLLAAQLRPLRGAHASDAVNEEWATKCSAAYAVAAADACRLAADLARRAQNLQTIVPKLRAKPAPVVVTALLDEDVLTCASKIGGLEPRPMRRLFERMIELGALRELSGRESFRLYGL